MNDAERTSSGPQGTLSIPSYLDLERRIRRWRLDYALGAHPSNLEAVDELLGDLEDLIEPAQVCASAVLGWGIGRIAFEDKEMDVRAAAVLVGTAFGIDWEEHDGGLKAMDDYGTALCLDEIEGRAENLIRDFDDKPKSEIIGELSKIIEASERLRPAKDGDS